MPPKFELWLDTHISSVIAKWLKEEKGLEVKSSYILKLHGLDDVDIYYKAKAAGYIIIITKDSDLAEIVQRLGSPPKIINIKTGNCRNRVLYRSISHNIDRCIRLLTQFDLDSVDLYLKT